MSKQRDLFGPDPSSPLGLTYQPDLITVDEKARLLTQLNQLEFEPFQFRGFLGSRCVVSFGWRYDFNTAQLRPVDEIPAFLQPLRDLSAHFAGVPAPALQHALVTEYAPALPLAGTRTKACSGT
jgi:hypothetical protein